jgi:hypothetical protein
MNRFPRKYSSGLHLQIKNNFCSKKFVPFLKSSMIRSKKVTIITKESNLGKRVFMSDISLTANGHTNSGDATAGVRAGALSEDDFVMMCPFRDGGLRDAILALYYLPPQFKLRVIIDAATAKLPFGSLEGLKNRISLETEMGTPVTASPFSSANAVVYSDTTPVQSESEAPRIVISKSAHASSRKGNIFTISEDSPEALASALLSLAKVNA